MTDYEKIISLLASAGVKFIIVGGAAAFVHGSSRLTNRLDVVYSRHGDNVARLVEALKPLHPRLRGALEDLPFRWDAETIKHGLNFTLQTSAGALDILGEITLGGGFDQLLPDSEQMEVAGHDCMVLGLKRLIEVKRAAARPKDFEEIAELQVILEERNR
jgi:predicted nucleotidyltransferase